jgi:hypothetical protein
MGQPPWVNSVVLQGGGSAVEATPERAPCLPPVQGSDRRVPVLVARRFAGKL